MPNVDCDYLVNAQLQLVWSLPGLQWSGPPNAI